MGAHTRTRSHPSLWRAAAFGVCAFLMLALVQVGLAPASASAEGWFMVDTAQRWVGGGSWATNSYVTVQIDSVSNGLGGTDYSNTAPTNSTDGWFNLNDISIDIQPGDWVTVTDGSSAKLHIVQFIDVYGFNLDADTVWGVAPPGASVMVQADDYRNNVHTQSWRTVVADGGGAWMADFTEPDGGEPAYDVRYGTQFHARVSDGDGDQSSASESVFSPNFTVQPGNDSLSGGGWPGSSTLTIVCENPLTPASPDFQTTAQCNEGGWLNAPSIGYDILPGDQVTVSTGIYTKETIVTALTVGGANMNADVVTGTAEPGSQVQVIVWDGSPMNPMRFVTAEPDGTWLADFSVVGGPEDWGRICDLVVGSQGGAMQGDDDGDQTQASWRIRSPHVDGHPHANTVSGNGWLPNTAVMLTIDDPSTGPGLDYMDSPSTDSMGNFWLGLQMSGFTLAPDHIITVSDGELTKTLIVTNLTINEVDPDTDVVRGVAAVGATITVGIQNSMVNRDVLPELDGSWEVDFTDAIGPEPPQQGFDVVAGTGGWSNQRDEDGDNTVAGWRALAPQFGADRFGDRIWGGDWPTGDVTIDIDDPGTLEAPDYTRTAPVDEWNSFWFQASDEGIDLQVGWEITVSGGAVVKSTTITDLEITGTDVDADTITGHAQPGVEIQVIVNMGGGQDQPMRFVTADGGGVWVADFGTPVGDGSGWQQAWDLQLGAMGWATEYDGDADQTQVTWRISNPWFGVNAADEGVWGGDWAANGAVDISIDDPGAAGVEFTTQAGTDGDGNFGTGTSGEFDIQAGFLVTVTDGKSTKEHTVTLLTLGGVDVDSDVVTGTAEPGSEVQVYINTDGGDQPNRYPVADENGEWVADFSTPASEEPWGQTWDIVPGTDGNAFQMDVDGDHTAVNWRVMNPRFTVRSNTEELWGNDWVPDSSVTVEVDDPGTPEVPDANQNVDTDGEGNFGTWFDQFDIQAGFLVTVTDGTSTKNLTVTSLALTGVDTESDTVSGTADPDAELWSWVDNTEIGWNVTVGGDGTWFLDYAGIYDIMRSSSGAVEQADEDGDVTQVGWRVLNTRVAVHPRDNWFELHEWPAGDPVFITIDKPGTPQNPDWSGAGTTDWSGYWQPEDGVGDYDIEPGDLVTATDGAITRELFVSNLTVTEVDQDTDQVRGTADADSALRVDIYNEWGSSREVIADSGSAWTADFSVGIGDEPWQQPYDIVKGDQGSAVQPDEDGDETWADWHVLNTMIGISPDDPRDHVNANDWPDGSQVTFTFDDPATVGSDYETVIDIQPGGWGEAYELPYDIKAGDTVTATDGITEKMVLVTTLKVVGVDPDTDTVWGTAPAGTTVRVEAWVDAEFDTAREVVADENGEWTADYSVAQTGEGYDRPAIDLNRGDSGWAFQLDNDDDRVQCNWHIPFPAFNVDPQGNAIEGWEFAPLGTVTITVDVTSTPAAVDFEITTETDEGGNFWLGIDPAEFDLDAEQVVTVTDGNSTKSHIIRHLTVESADALTDLVTGTAEPGGEVWVRTWRDWGEIDRTPVADENGDWVADFSAVDLVPGDQGLAGGQGDADGDSTQIPWRILNPAFEVHVEPVASDGMLYFKDWTVGTTLTVTVDDPATPLDPDFSVEEPVRPNEEDGDGFGSSFNYPFKAGDVVTVTDGVVTKTHVVTSLAITSVDVAGDQVNGTADPDSMVHLWCDGDGERNTIVLPDRTWVGDFSTEWMGNGPFDIVRGSSGSAQQFDEDGDETTVGWYVPNPFFEVYYDSDEIRGYDFAEEETVTVEVDQAGSPQGPDFALDVKTDADGSFSTGEGMGFDVTTDDIVTVTDSLGPKDHVVRYLTVTGADYVSDTVSGTADPFSEVHVWFQGEFEIAQRIVFADGAGAWEADFSVWGGGYMASQVHDLLPGEGGKAVICDEDGDCTAAEWQAASIAAPVAMNDGYSIAEDTTLSVAAAGVLDNDTYDPGDFVLEVLTGASHGTLDFHTTTGAFDYRGGSNWHGTDAFTYRVGDGVLWSDPATVTITVTAVNDGPVAHADAYSVAEDATLTVAAAGVLANDTDVESDALTVSSWTSPAHGTLVTDSNGAFVYKPAANYNGTDSFQYRATDGPAFSAYVSVTITVTAVNDPPEAQADTWNTQEDTALVVHAPGILGNDTDVDADVLQAYLLVGPAHGTLSLADTGEATYTPNTNWSGTDSFTYRVFDGTAYSSSATVTIHVDPVADKPIAVNDSWATSEGTVLVVPAPGVLGNDSDGDGDTLTVTAVSAVSTGTLEVAPSGAVTFTPPAGFHGAATFTYRATDGGLDSEPALVTITVASAASPTAIEVTSPSKTLSKYGYSYTFTGILTSNGVPLGGKRIVLQSASSPTGTFTDTAYFTTTAADGSFSFKVVPRDKTYYRASFAGETDEYLPSVSEARYGLPRPSVGRPYAPTTMSRTKYYTIYGYLKPEHTSSSYPVRIYKYRYVSGKWKSYGYAWAKASDYSTYSKFARKIRLPYKGKWRLRAYAPADSEHAAVWSSTYDYVTVK